MHTHRPLIGLLAAILLAACSPDSTSPTAPGPVPPADSVPNPPASIVGRWSARTAAGSTLPYVVERFPDWPKPRSVHEIQLDHGDLRLHAGGRYQFVVYSSEWGSEDPTSGKEFVLQFRFTDRDFGTWTRSGTEIVLTSGWIQHRVTRGSVMPDGSLQLQHGLTWGDPLLAVRYRSGTAE